MVPSTPSASSRRGLLLSSAPDRSGGSKGKGSHDGVRLDPLAPSIRLPPEREIIVVDSDDGVTAPGAGSLRQPVRHSVRPSSSQTPLLQSSMDWYARTPATSRPSTQPNPFRSSEYADTNTSTRRSDTRRLGRIEAVVNDNNDRTWPSTTLAPPDHALEHTLLPKIADGPLPSRSKLSSTNNMTNTSKRGPFESASTRAPSSSLDSFLPSKALPVPSFPFPPAVKERVYSSAPRPRLPRNAEAISIKHEMRGSVPTAPCLAGPANAPTGRDAAVAAAPVRIHKPRPIAQPIMKSEAPEVGEVQTLTLQQRPRTNGQLPSTMPAYNSLSSIGTPGDPYCISSGSDNDSDFDADADAAGRGNRHRASPNPCPLSSFINFTDTHEPASDVEAVLKEFPKWLGSLDPTEPQPISVAVPAPALQPTTTVQATTNTRQSQSTTAATPSEKPGDDEGRTMREARGNGFRVGYGGDDKTLSPSPVPIPIMNKRPASAIEQVYPPAKRIAVPAQSSPLRVRETAATSFPPLSLSLSSPSRLLRRNDQTVIPDSDEDEYIDLHFGHEHEEYHDNDHKHDFNDNENHLVQCDEDEDVPSRKKKRRRHSGQDKAASRHRNRDRLAWRRRQQQQRRR